MSRAKAVAALEAEGFQAWVDATASDCYERIRKPWRGGYPFVNVRLADDEVAEVHDFGNDP